MPPTGPTELAGGLRSRGLVTRASRPDAGGHHPVAAAWSRVLPRLPPRFRAGPGFSILTPPPQPGLGTAMLPLSWATAGPLRAALTSLHPAPARSCSRHPPQAHVGRAPPRASPSSAPGLQPLSPPHGDSSPLWGSLCGLPPSVTLYLEPPPRPPPCWQGLPSR